LSKRIFGAESLFDNSVKMRDVGKGQVRDSDDVTRTATITTDLGDGQWYHILATYDRGGFIQPYLDGVPAGSATTMVDGNLDSTGPLMIGINEGVTFNQGLRGEVDDFAIWDRLLTPEEIKVLVNP